ncbi:STAS/SEC14 domain-containing protein [Arthrobacter sp. Sa2CUA1]|uniref:STAS/SEC14 domain-containing protein n=2 Tax=Arthrobacter gallicola TaxID=2762225 RepID=A0ABR8UTZ9_9MICC|nr:STAS/SEC14 domain-containing protein [Arthrobacter gallicola]
MAAQAAKKFEELQPQGLKPLLLDLTGVDSISRSARAVFGSSRAALAVAVLGATPVDRVIANFLLGGDAPSFPTKYFTRVDEAVAWLGTYADV